MARIELASLDFQSNALPTKLHLKGQDGIRTHDTFSCEWLSKPSHLTSLPPARDTPNWN